jgi:hypothetical protein
MLDRFELSIRKKPKDKENDIISKTDDTCYKKVSLKEIILAEIIFILYSKLTNFNTDLELRQGSLLLMKNLLRWPIK